MKLKINSLDLSFQTRFGLSEETVHEYAELMGEGTDFPAVSVFNVDGVHILVDGYHRIAAVTQIGGDEIEADVTVGTRDDALRAALKANSEHGQRRSNADKRRALEVAWENRAVLFSEFKGQNADGTPNGLPSSRQLAEITGVSHVFSHNFIKSNGVLTVNTPTRDATTVTSEHFEERKEDVRALLKSGKDRFGVDIPENLRAAFLSIEQKKISRVLDRIRSLAENRMHEGDLIFLSLGQQFLIHLDNAKRNIKFCTPYCVCLNCHGLGCNCCNNRGFQTLSQYNNMPRELKAEKQ